MNLIEVGKMTQNNPTSPENIDVVIVGAGFGGLYMLHNLRKLGYNAVVVESGSEIGGVWFWNAYPGARVDTNIPFYEFTMDDAWKDWTWTEKYPGRDELRNYFRHVDSKLKLSKDVRFNTTITSAHFNTSHDEWRLQTDKGGFIEARYMILATGFASKRYIPHLKGLESFSGDAYHTGTWPQGGLEVKGKRVGVIGTGASGVQVIQEIAPEVGHLTVFQRTPNLALPMRQETLNIDKQQEEKKGYLELFKISKATFSGYDYEFEPKASTNVPEREQQEFWESLWDLGGFHIWLGNYNNLMKEKKINNSVYKFWRGKTRERITKNDLELIENLAPTIAPHAFGTKRPCLEQQYYEVYNQPNVDLVNIKKTPIMEITAKGVLTSQGEVELDILILATGFDGATGGITSIDIHGSDTGTVKEKWGSYVSTFLGMTTHGYPNMFFMYGPQGPTAFANGPTCNEAQGGWIIELLGYMKRMGKSRVEPSQAAEDDYTKLVNELTNETLLPETDSWYMGANIPGKPRQSLNYVAGMPSYMKLCWDCAKENYSGFKLS